ncbi:hypothetical protein Lfu02_61640 [Longispora fulva]|uniref:DUF397 domain-containing protein n=1 Tax=Longispora fulva TaxID=619741 RepID=A0A8J7KIR4_9ACTN|nr:DUF397 domain-containing protein [Longispora fulva]MBG6134586.1 hypothetical protein [Longispora fulva]GIG61792.1 hypothetical protein Lfu02_61640 [Longispora fulva]
MSTVDFGDGWVWRKSRRSADNGGNCVCVARDAATGMIGLRDSKEGADGTPTWFAPAEWSGFLAGVQAGQFNGS